MMRIATVSAHLPQGGILVVEELEHALARGAHIYAEITGYGATSDGYDMVAPSGGAQAGRRWRCRVSARWITSTPTVPPLSVGDTKELEAIQTLFGSNAPKLSATKAMTGHALGAAGVHEAVYSLLMMEHGFIAPSINIETLDEKAEGLPIVRAYEEA